MKKAGYTLIIGLCLASFSLSAHAGTSVPIEEAWQIDRFHSEIFITKEGTIEITETIEADFSNEPHRGILRSIPYRYENKKLDIKVHFARDAENAEWELNTYRQNGYLNIEMDTFDDSLLTQKATFILTYSVYGAINYFEQENPREELYWNVNGTEWPVPTTKVLATVHLPGELTTEQAQHICFSGAFGVQEQQCKAEKPNERTYQFETTAPLDRYENLTIALSMPPGTIEKPGLLRRLKNYAPYIPAPLALIGMLLLWYLKGRDEKTARDTIMPHYTPPQGLLPIETGTLIDEKLHPQDITSSIIDNAIKGYIEIKKTKDSYELTLRKPYEENRKPMEMLILRGLFPENTAGDTVSLETLKQTFPTLVPKIEKSVMDELVKEGYFPASPARIRVLYIGFGSAIVWLGIMSSGILENALGVSIAIAGGIIALMGQFMPRKTRKGTETYYQLKGLYEYINTAEKDRMKFQEQHEILFEKLLPYAVSFGLAKKWAKAFEGILKIPPKWYHTTGTHFIMADFAHDLTQFVNKSTTELMPTPKGSGGAWGGGSGFSGGFSGGGFGGGGGRGL